MMGGERGCKAIGEVQCQPGMVALLPWDWAEHGWLGTVGSLLPALGGLEAG